MPFFRKPNNIELSERLIFKLEKEYKSHWQNYLRLANSSYSQFKNNGFVDSYNKKNPNNNGRNSEIRKIQDEIDQIPKALAMMLLYKKKIESYTNSKAVYIAPLGEKETAETVNQDDISEANALLNKSKFFHEKNNFSWENLDIMKEEINLFALAAEANRFTYKVKLLRFAKEINFELRSVSPDLENVRNIIQKIRNEEVLSKSTQNGDDLPLKWTKFAGGNIFMRLLFGLVEGIASILCVAVAIAALIPMSILGSPYFGTLHFLKDSVQWCVESIATLVKAILFPVDMLHSYLTTGSAFVLYGESYLILNELSNLCDQNEFPNSQIERGIRFGKTIF